MQVQNWKFNDSFLFLTYWLPWPWFWLTNVDNELCLLSGMNTSSSVCQEEKCKSKKECIHWYPMGKEGWCKNLNVKHRHSNFKQCDVFSLAKQPFFHSVFLEQIISKNKNRRGYLPYNKKEPDFADSPVLYKTMYKTKYNNFRLDILNLSNWQHIPALHDHGIYCEKYIVHKWDSERHIEGFYLQWAGVMFKRYGTLICLLNWRQHISYAFPSLYMVVSFILDRDHVSDRKWM